MGCWDETCGLTNTPIRDRRGPGVPCVLVVLDQSVEREGFRRGWDFASQVISIHKGRYNGYGGVDDVTPKRAEVAAILFHRDAWDACVARRGAADASPANAWRKMGDRPEIPDLGEFVAVLNVADAARRDVLSGLRFRGQQDNAGESRLYRFVADLAERHIPGTKRKDASP